MAAFTSKASGNWSASGTTTWTQSGVPGNGDTVTIGTGHAIIVDVNTTIGASGAADSVAVQITATGTLEVATGVTFTLRGCMVIGNTTFTMDHGSTLTFDSSLAAGTPVYYVQLADNTNQTACEMICNGTTGSHCTINKAGGSANGQIRNANAGFISQIKATFTDFSDLGTTAGGPAYAADAIGLDIGSVGEFTLTDCTFARCSMITINTLPGGANLTIQRCSLTAPIDPSHWVTWFQFSAATTGLRLVTDNVFQSSGAKAIMVFSTSAGGLTFSRNMFGHSIYTSMSGSAPMADCSDNLAVKAAGDATAVTLGETGGTVTRLYIHDGIVDATDGSGGGIIPNAPSVSGIMTFSGLIYDSVAAQEGNDAFQVSSPSAVVTFRVTNAIFIPNSRGLMPGDFTAHGNVDVIQSYEHCTIMAGEKSPSSTGLAAALYGSGYQFAANQFALFRNNLVWCPDATTSARLALTSLSGSQTADAVTPSGCDYNGKFQLQNGTIFDAAGANGVTKVGYDVFYSSNQAAIGAHDVVLSGSDPIVAGPKFVDTTRNLVTWDIAFLGSPVGTAWTTGHSYVVGDVASAASSTFYNNATVNFVCILNHTSNSGNATNGKPGASTTTAWDTNWEPQSYSKMRVAVAAGTTYVVGGVTYNAIRALYEWVRAGFSPQEAALHNTASDGTDIGAVSFTAPASTAGGAALVLGM